MNSPVGIRREDKNRFEARVPLTPEDMAFVMQETGAKFKIQPSELRIFSDDEYRNIGAEIAENISDCPLVFAVKEIPNDLFHEGYTYMFFSHTIKGQDYNMGMLRKMMYLKCNLIDYEKVTDDKNRRLIFFGRYAGLAGMIDSLYAFGQRLKAEGIANPFSTIKNTYKYNSLDDAKSAISEVAELIKKDGLPEKITPLLTGFAGYGNVSLGAQEIYDILPTEEIKPDEIEKLYSGNGDHSKTIYKVVFKEEHMVEPIDESGKFELQDYYDNPEKYRSKFETYLPNLTILMNCIYWDTMYPRLMTIDYTKELYSGYEIPRLRVIGDITCDINGAIETTVKSTEPDIPAFLYDIHKDEAVNTFAGDGPIIMAVDNLPCELPKESSGEFSKALKVLAPAIIKADFTQTFDESGLPDEIKRAMILYKGEFTPGFRFMERFLSKENENLGINTK
ncbi:MAG: hypothetical protein GY855_17930 [candidate division Zixibacteria bacterium]|nr:hypothetical protein [candidate division Zixibacteria bacterium]